MGIQALLAFAASNETQDLVTVVPWTLIFQICNLFIQVHLIKKYLFKPINDILEKRQNLADKAIKEAREEKEEALKDKLFAMYENLYNEAMEGGENMQAKAILDSIVKMAGLDKPKTAIQINNTEKTDHSQN